MPVRAGVDILPSVKGCLLLAWLLAWAALSAVAAAADLRGAEPAPGLPRPGPAQAGSGPTYADDEVAARAGDTRILWKDLDPVIRLRRILSKDGRDSLKHLAQSLILERLAKERGIDVSDAVVDRRWKDLDAQVRASGDPDGISGLMKKARLSPEEFRRFLRLSFVQETLTRRALGLDDRTEVKGEQQELWMEEAMRDRGYRELPPPWADGIVARCSDFAIEVGELVSYLRRRLSPKDLQTDCYQLLLLRRTQAKMPDLAPQTLEKSIDHEIARRRDEAAADPAKKGIPWERLLAAEGYVLDSVREDPAIRIAALARLWVDRTSGPEGLKKTYEAERAHFDGLYGAAIETSMLYLRGAQFKNDLNPRSFQEAEGELASLAKGIRSFDDFQRLARDRSEDAGTRASGGALGFVSAGTDRVPVEIREAVAKALLAHEGGGGGHDPAHSLAGPIRVPTGAALLWLGERRATPTWDTMAAHVHRELRKRFLDETLPKASVSTAFEAP